jgi:hypothetical protein
MAPPIDYLARASGVPGADIRRAWPGRPACLARTSGVGGLNPA